MPRTSHRSDLILLAGLAVLTAAVILLLLGEGWLWGKGESSSWMRTSRSVNIEGTKLYYTLLERLGYHVERLEHPLLDDALSGVGLLFIIDPLRPLESGERVFLERWVRQGGVLVCTLTPAIAHDLSVPFKVAAGEAPHERPGPPAAEAPPGAAQADAHGTGTGPLARDAPFTTFKTSRVLDWQEDVGAADREGVEVLLEDGAGIRVAMVSANKGKVIVLSDSSLLANGWIGDHDNVLNAVDLVAFGLSQGRGGLIAYDEYHFGYGRHESGLGAAATLVFQTRAGWAILCMTASGLLFLLYEGRRFGTRRAPPRPQRRSKLEFVFSVGAAFRSAGAYRLVLGLIVHRFRHRAADLAGLPVTAPARRIAAALERRNAKGPRGLATVLSQCEEALAGERLSGHRGAALLRRLSEAETEIFHGAQTGKRTHKPPRW